VFGTFDFVVVVVVELLHLLSWLSLSSTIWLSWSYPLFRFVLISVLLSALLLLLFTFVLMFTFVSLFTFGSVFVFRDDRFSDLVEILGFFGFQTIPQIGDQIPFC
jgi:hypothetical protein